MIFFKSTLTILSNYFLTKKFNRMTEFDPNKRPSCDELLNHEIFAFIHEHFSKNKLNNRYLIKDLTLSSKTTFDVYDENKKSW